MKHAFLILAHNNFKVIRSLIHQIDNRNVDIYIHINKKIDSFPKEEIKSCAKLAKVVFVPRYPINYCDYSMMKGVISLLSTASVEYHDYYHLISGSDLLIKKFSDFEAFFDKNYGAEFVGFSKEFDLERVIYRHYFTGLCRGYNRYITIVATHLRRFLIQIQKYLQLKNSFPNDITPYKGADWYSVTHQTVKYMLEFEPQFRKYFKYSYCPTEFFAQTTICYWNLQSKVFCLENEGGSISREMDWIRGKPYTYKMEDFHILVQSDKMFARKFDECTDMEIVNQLVAYTTEKE